MAKKQNTDAETQFDSDIVFPESAKDVQGIDLTNVEEQPRFAPLAPQIYSGHIDSAEYGTSRNGNEMITWTIKVQAPDGSNRNLFYHTTLTDSGLSRLKRLLTRLAPFCPREIDLSNFIPQRDSLLLIGTPCRVRVKTQYYEGTLRNSVGDILPPAGDEGLPF